MGGGAGMPDFLSVDDVLLIHADQIERYGGDAGLRDRGLLEAAVAMPMAGLASGLLHADLIEMAGAYLYHIVRNHPFVDGNKRTGTASALVFLDMHDITIDAHDDDLVAVVLSVARGEGSKADVSAFLRRHART